MIDDRPLDALVPGLSAAPRSGRARVVEALIKGDPAWIFPLDRDPGGAPALRRWAARHFEATLLGHLSRPGPRVVGEPTAGFGRGPVAGIHVWMYAAVAGEVARALRPFSLVPSALDGPRWEEVRASIAVNGGGVSGPPTASYAAPVHTRDGLSELHAVLVDETLEPWGLAPGRPAQRLLRWASGQVGHALTPDAAGLDAVEALIVDTTPDVIRWMPPLVFQGFADLMGVVAQQTMGARVAWAECAPEADGYVPPPLLRIENARHSAPVHLPIGQHLIAWCVMPLVTGESPPPLSAWLAHEVS